MLFSNTVLVLSITCIGLVTPSATSASKADSLANKQTPAFEQSSITPKLRKVGSRGFYALSGPFAEFDPTHPSVEIWTPSGNNNVPVVVYAHGGAGFREDDRARVELFRSNGFATISFDSYEMNGFEDWQFVTRKVTNGGKQGMIWGVFQGAFEFAETSERWDNRNIVLYGGSNGGRVVLYAASELSSNSIRAAISEAPAATGFALGDYDIPTLIPFGELDNWAGRSESDFVWTRRYPNSPVSIEDWVTSRRELGRPVEFVFYKDAGHLMFEGPLKQVTVSRGDTIAFTAYEGASEAALKKYKQDVLSFARKNLKN